MKLQEYLEINSKMKRIEKLIDVYAIDYAIEKLKPAIDDGFEYEDITNFLLTRFDEFVQGGKLDELIEQDKKINEDGGE